MSKISSRISALFGFTIKEGQWTSYIDALDQEGEPTRRHMMMMIFILCEELEKMEKEIENLKDKGVESVKTTPKG